MNGSNFEPSQNQMHMLARDIAIYEVKSRDFSTNFGIDQTNFKWKFFLHK